MWILGLEWDLNGDTRKFMAEPQIAPLIRERKVSLQVEEALKILKTVDHRKCIQVPPDKPSGKKIMWKI